MTTRERTPEEIEAALKAYDRWWIDHEVDAEGDGERAIAAALAAADGVSPPQPDDEWLNNVETWASGENGISLPADTLTLIAALREARASGPLPPPPDAEYAAATYREAKSSFTASVPLTDVGPLPERGPTPGDYEHYIEWHRAAGKEHEPMSRETFDSLGDEWHKPASGPLPERGPTPQPVMWRYRNVYEKTGPARWHFCEYDPTQEIADMARPSHITYEVEPLFTDPVERGDVAEQLAAKLQTMLDSVQAPDATDAWWVNEIRAALAAFSAPRIPEGTTDE